MKNFVAVGHNVTVPAPAAVASGAGVLLGALFGVANGAAASGEDVVLSTVGVFDLPKAAGAINVGAAVYWTGMAVTTTATDNTKIGVAIAAAASGDATARVRLNGSF